MVQLLCEYWFVREYVRRHCSSETTILQLSCGLGYLTYALNSSGYIAGGMDLSEVALAEAIRRFGSWLSTLDASSGVVDGLGFDAIITL